MYFGARDYIYINSSNISDILLGNVLDIRSYYLMMSYHMQDTNS